MPCIGLKLDLYLAQSAAAPGTQKRLQIYRKAEIFFSRNSSKTAHWCVLICHFSIHQVLLHIINNMYVTHIIHFIACWYIWNFLFLPLKFTIFLIVFQELSVLPSSINITSSLPRLCSVVLCPVTTNHLQMTFTGMRQKSDHFSLSVLCRPLIGQCPTYRGPNWLNLTLTLHRTNGSLMTVGSLAVKLGQKEHSTSFNCLDILYCSTSPLISHWCWNQMGSH